MTCLVEPRSAESRLKFLWLQQIVVPSRRQFSEGPSASNPISGRDVSNIAFHNERSRRGRHNELGARDVRHIGCRFGRARTRSEIGRACDRSGAGAPLFGPREPARCGDTATGAATRAPGLHSEGDGRLTGQKPAKATYRKLPTAPADLCPATVRRSRGFRAGDCPIAKRRVARTPDCGARRIQRVPYLSTSDSSSRQIPRPWVAA